jgi:hypothetical protein
MLLEEGVAPKDIGVIAPYNAQVTPLPQLCLRHYNEARSWFQVQLHPSALPPLNHPFLPEPQSRFLRWMAFKAERKRCFPPDSACFSAHHCIIKYRSSCSVWCAATRRATSGSSPSSAATTWLSRAPAASCASMRPAYQVVFILTPIVLLCRCVVADCETVSRDRFGGVLFIVACPSWRHTSCAGSCKC